MSPPKSNLCTIEQSHYEDYRPDGMPEPASKEAVQPRTESDSEKLSSTGEGSHYSKYRPNSEEAKGVDTNGSGEFMEPMGEIVPGYNDNDPNSYRPGKPIPNSSRDDGARAARASSVAANDGSQAGSDDGKEELKRRPPIVYRPTNS